MKNISRRNFLQVCGLGIVAAAGASALTGCGGSDSGSGSTAGDSGSKVEAIKARGKLNCGFKADVLGYGYMNTETNE